MLVKSCYSYVSKTNHKYERLMYKKYISAGVL